MRFSIGFVLAFSLILSGCNGERRRVSRETSAMTVKFSKLVKDGKTTREQEQRFIHAMKDVTFELDRSIRGTKKAEQTKRSAEIEAETGVSPSQPLNLDD